MSKTYKQINKELNIIKGWYEYHSHNDRYDTYVAVNVKRYHDHVNVDSLIDSLIDKPDYKEYKSELKSYLVDDCSWYNDSKRNCNNYNFWLEHETEYLFFDYLYEIAETDKEKSYIKTLDYFNRTERHKSPIDCQFGRSGGWIGVVSWKDIYTNIDNLQDYLYNAETDKNYYHDCLDMLDTVKHEFEAVKWAYNKIDEFNKNLNYENELEFRITEDIKEFMRSKELDMDIEGLEDTTNQYIHKV